MTTAAHKAEWLRNNLKQGETYAGIVLGQNGEKDYHLVVTGPEVLGITWKKAVAWAKKQGGELPNRRELRLLWVNAAEEFAKDWYWSGEQRAANSDYAWCQGFNNGYQDNNYTDGRLRARAVRRISID